MAARSAVGTSSSSPPPPAPASASQAAATTAATNTPTAAPATSTSTATKIEPARTTATATATVTTTHGSTTESDAASWDSNLFPHLGFSSRRKSADDTDGESSARSVDESCKRSLDHFPIPDLCFSTPTLEFDFRVAVALRPEPSQVQGRAHKEITAIQSGTWSGSFGHGKVVAGGYDLGQARGFRPIRIVEGAFIMQTTDEAPATLEMRTRGSLSGPCDILDALLSARATQKIDCRKYSFRMFLTIKTTDKRYAEIVNCGLWVASGVWKDNELVIDAYRVA